jgi:hypothetical protein
MARRQSLGDLRNVLEEIAREVMEGASNGEAPNSAILTRLKNQRPNLIKFFTPQLVDIALTKLLNEVSGRNRARLPSGYEFDLFGDYGKIPNSVTIGRGQKKDTAKLSIAEAKSWLRNHSNRTVQSDHAGFRRLVEECEKYVESDDETIEIALERKRTAEKSTARQLELTQ